MGIKDTLSKAGEKLKSVNLGDGKTQVSFSASFTAIMAMVIFATVVIVAVARTGDPMKYLFSPITIITVLMIFLAISGVLKLNLALVLLIIILLVLTMYQGKLDKLWDDLMDDIAIIRGKVIKPSDSEVQKVKQKFYEKYAEYKSDHEVYVYIKQVDDIIRDKVGRWSLDEGTIWNNYYVLILPDIISVRKGLPIGTTTNERITLWAVDHKAEVPIVVDGEVYTVLTKAYLLKVSELHTIKFSQLFEIGLHLGYTNRKIRVWSDLSYDEFLERIKEFIWEIPDELYINTEW